MSNGRGFIVRMKIRDDAGNVVDEIDCIAFKGLLAKAHEEGLKFTKTTLVQAPSDANGKTAIVQATVRTRRGTFSGIGDANPGNVNRRIAPHCIRMAETRAIARALRVAVNIGEVSVEEIGGDVALEPIEPQATHAPAPTRNAPEREERNTDATPRPPPPFRGRDTTPREAAPSDRRGMSEEQKKLLFRLAYDLGFNRDNVRDKVLDALGVERLEWATRSHASAGIDALRHELDERRGMQNGHGANGEAHHAS